MDVDDTNTGGLELPSTPATIGGSSSVPRLPDTPTAFQSFPPPSEEPSVSTPDPASFYDTPGPSAPIPPSVAPTFVPPPAANVPVAPAPYVPSQPSHGLDDNTVQLAQKHARWAVSALNFDDVDTAIKELRNSLKLLGAS